jgi:sugar phosphate permease
MLAVGFCGMFASGPGQSFNISVFFNPLIEELGLSRTSLSLAYGVGTMTAALGLSGVGGLVDRLGQRRMLALVSFLLGAVCLLFPLAGNLLLLYLAFTAVRFLGQGSLMLVSTNLVAQWFSRRRGLALSLISLGFALGTAVYPPLAQRMIDTIGWRWSWVWLGLGVWVLMIPASLALVINRPEELGLVPDGGAHPRPPSATAQAGQPPAAEGEDWTRAEALRTPAFWIMALALSVPSLLITGVIIHQISYFEAQGLSRQAAANIFTVTAVSMVGFMLLFGYLLDRYETRFVVAGGIFTMAVAMWAMRLADNLPMAFLYGVMLGVVQGAVMNFTAYVWPRYFGRRHLGSIQGPALTVAIIGASIGPIPFGLAYDLLGGYHEAVLALSLLPVAFALAVAFTRPPVKGPRAPA